MTPHSADRPPQGHPGAPAWGSLAPAADGPPDAPGRPGAPPQAGQDPHGPGAAAAPLPVLYVDDNAVNALLMEAMFERLPGLVLRCETSPHRGLALALAAPPALLLIDIQMPGMDGYELLARLRAAPATRDVPAIAVSANAMPQDLARGQAAGFADYLTKPLDMDRLLQALHAVLPGWTPPPADRAT